MASKSKRYKKFYSTKYIIGYMIFLTGAWVLYFLYRDDMVNDESNTSLVIRGILYGIFTAVIMAIGIKMTLNVRKNVSKKKREKKRQARNGWD